MLVKPDSFQGSNYVDIYPLIDAAEDRFFANRITVHQLTSDTIYVSGWGELTPKEARTLAHALTQSAALHEAMHPTADLEQSEENTQSEAGDTPGAEEVADPLVDWKTAVFAQTDISGPNDISDLLKATNTPSATINKIQTAQKVIEAVMAECRFDGGVGFVLSSRDGKKCTVLYDNSYMRGANLSDLYINRRHELAGNEPPTNDELL